MISSSDLNGSSSGDGVAGGDSNWDVALLCTGQLKDQRLSINELWSPVEEYLRDALSTLRGGGVEMTDRLRDVRHRMKWYAVIYHMCGGHPLKSCEVYHRLVAFLLDVLKCDVLGRVLRDALSLDLDLLLKENPRKTEQDEKEKANCKRGPLSHLSVNLCQEFVRQHRLFMTFRRVVLSCFGYLDQCYVHRLHLDPISTLCVKMFFIVVYEPLRELIVRELLLMSECARAGSLGQAERELMYVSLKIIFEILRTVACSVGTSGGCGQNVKLRQANSGSGSGSGGGGDCSGTTAKNTDGSVVGVELCESDNGDPLDLLKLDGVRALHHQLENGAISEVISHIRGNVGNLSASTAHMPSIHAWSYAPTAVKLPATTGTFTEKLSSPATAGRAHAATGMQPLHALIAEHFGRRYIHMAEGYYRKERARHLSTQEGREHYTEWASACFHMELSLVHCIDEPHFHNALQECLSRILLLEVHSDIIKDNNFGLGARLDAWSASLSLPYGAVSDLSPSATYRGGGSIVLPEKTEQVPSAVPLDSRDELTLSLKKFVTPFVRTGDEQCGLLLASELAGKVVVDAVACFKAYIAMGSRRQERGVTAAIDTSSGGKISWNTARALVSEDAAAVLVGGLVRVVDTYSGLVREQFDDFAPMQYAIRDVMRVLLNPEHWAQLGERLATAGVVDNTNIVEGNCIGAGGGMHGRGDRRCDSVSAVEPLSSMLRNHQGAKSAMAELNKLEAVRGAGAALPMPHLIAVYCGLLCRARGDGTNGDCDDFAHSVVSGIPTCGTISVAFLASLLNDKTAFIQWYKLLLANRLVLFPVGSNALTIASLSSATCDLPCLEKERSLMCELRRTLGGELTHGLVGMLRDYDSSASLTAAFAMTPTSAELGVELGVKLLTAVHWPSYTPISLIPCPSLSEAIKAFDLYYTAKFPSRRLTWVHSLGRATLHAVFAGVAKTVVADAVHSNILLLTSEAQNAAKEEHMPPETESTTGQAAVSAGHDACPMPSQGFITGQELAVALGMPFGSLRAYLALLVQSKSYNLLRRLPSPRSTSSTPTPAVPRGPTDEAVTTADAGHCCHSSSSAPLAPEDRFTLNPDFMHAQSSLSLATPHSLSALCKTGGPSTTSIGEMSAFHSTIPNPTTSDTAQRQQIAAAIVSVMKKQRVLHFSELLELTRQQLSSRFQPSAQLIKVLVEDLVAREFLRRSDANISVLEYVA